MYARENAGLYTITGGRLSDFVPYHMSKFPGLPVERCLLMLLALLPTAFTSLALQR